MLGLIACCSLCVCLSMTPAASARAVARPTTMRTQNLNVRSAAAAAPITSNHAAVPCRWISSYSRSARLAPSAAPAQTADAPSSDASPTAAAAAVDDSVDSPSHPPLPAPLFLRMPPIEGVGKCRLLRWVVEEGSRFEAGDVLAEIDSDLAVIEYKAQSGGVMALRRTQPGEQIIQGQILAVQVEEPDQIPQAQPWLKHVETIARRERLQREELEAKEEAEENAMRDIEKEKLEAETANAAAAAKQ